MNKKMKVGLLGCGKISEVYLRCSRQFSVFEISKCADLKMEYAELRAKEFDLEALEIDELLASKDLDIILNLTPPAVHAQLNLRALQSNKHVYCEKPFAVDFKDALKVAKRAKDSGLYAISAPDSFLCAAQQKARQLIDQGVIGKIFGGSAAVMFTVGYSSDHRDIGFFFRRGGGPLYDVGPYYLAPLVNILGPVRRIASCGGKLADKRTCKTGKNQGLCFPVEVNTHLQILLEFVNGTIISLLCSFDVYAHSLPHIELYGETGSIRLLEPSMFGEKLELYTAQERQWKVVESDFKFGEVCRGLGLADLADAIQNNRAPRCSPEFVIHIQEIMDTIDHAVSEKKFIELKTTCNRPALMSFLPEMNI